jgi:hypothetical protein
VGRRDSRGRGGGRAERAAAAAHAHACRRSAAVACTRIPKPAPKNIPRTHITRPPQRSVPRESRRHRLRRHAYAGDHRPSLVVGCADLATIEARKTNGADASGAKATRRERAEGSGHRRGASLCAAPAWDPSTQRARARAHTRAHAAARTGSGARRVWLRQHARRVVSRARRDAAGGEERTGVADLRRNLPVRRLHIQVSSEARTRTESRAAAVRVRTQRTQDDAKDRHPLAHEAPRAPPGLRAASGGFEARGGRGAGAAACSSARGAARRPAIATDVPPESQPSTTRTPGMHHLHRGYCAEFCREDRGTHTPVVRRGGSTQQRGRCGAGTFHVTFIVESKYKISRIARVGAIQTIIRGVQSIVGRQQYRRARSTETEGGHHIRAVQRGRQQGTPHHIYECARKPNIRCAQYAH